MRVRSRPAHPDQDLGAGPPARAPIRVVALVAGLVLVLVVVVAGCSKPAVSADDAASALQNNLQLPDAPLQCMRDKFGDADVAAVMDPEHIPTDDQRARFVVAVRACIPIDSFAGLLADSLASPDTDGPVTPDQPTCVRTTIEAMTTSEQDQLYVHFSNPAALDADAVRDTTARLVAVCGLGGTDPSGTVVGPVDPGLPTATGR